MWRCTVKTGPLCYGEVLKVLLQSPFPLTACGSGRHLISESFINVLVSIFFFFLFCKSESCFLFLFFQKPHPRGYYQPAQRLRRLPRRPQRLHRGCECDVAASHEPFGSTVDRLFEAAFLDLWLGVSPQDVTPQNFLAVLKGDASKVKGGSGKVLKRWVKNTKTKGWPKRNGGKMWLLFYSTLLSLSWQRSQRSRLCVLHRPRGARNSGFP